MLNGISETTALETREAGFHLISLCDLCRSSIHQGLGVRCRGMSDMNIHTPKIGVVETIGVLGAAVGLAELLRQLAFHLGDARNINRQTIIGMLKDQLDSIIQESNSKIWNCPTSPANVDARLKQLTMTAQELVDSVLSSKLGRLKDVLVHGKFDKRIEELRTGITDIGNTLSRLRASHVSQYQVSPALSQQHLAPAPGQTFMQLTVTYPIHHNMDVAQALGVVQGQIPFQAAPLGYPLGVVQGQIPFQVAPLGYPPGVQGQIPFQAAPLGYPPGVVQGQIPFQAAPLGYPPGIVQGHIPVPTAPLAFPPAVYSPAASPSAFYPPFGSPAYSYSPRYC